mmetsp:Transcript_34937/g.93546  ORF Transcript_34937/g.93546 Transcript_34937/m.93546 type:complete len:126 (+) Transcript_34937:100-477(+)
MAAAEAAAGSPSAAGTGRLGGRCGSPSSASMCSGGERRSFDRGLSGSSSRGGERDGGGCRRAGSCGWEPPCDEQQEEAQIFALDEDSDVGGEGEELPRAQAVDSADTAWPTGFSLADLFYIEGSA